jgi:multicomponent Na+:H+ antiporter subunit E
MWRHTRTPPDPRKRHLTPRLLRAAAARVTGLAVLWWAVTEGDPTSWWFGLPVVAIAALLSLSMHRPGQARWVLSALPAFLAYFLRQSLAGGLDVARRALHPKLRLNPAIIDYTVRLPPGPARVLMIDTLSLLPGTLSADLVSGRVRVHVLDVRQPFHCSLVRLEEHVAALFGLTLPPRQGRSA